MNRRKFITSSAITVSAFSVPIKVNANNLFFNQPKPRIKPNMLKEGDTVGLIVPGSFITEEELFESVANLEKLGLKSYYTENILAKKGYLGGTDEQRVSDLHHMFENKEVKGIVCARGGYGCNRILPMINYDLIKNNPKILIGYSDITALLYAIYAKTGLISFHGPVGISTFNDFSLGYMKQTLMERLDRQFLISSEEDKTKEDPAYKIYTIAPGVAAGELVGGNLSIAVSLLGTPYDVDYSGKIVFLEDIGEKPYKIDRMLTELLLAGKLQKASGIVLGVFVDCEIGNDDRSIQDSLNLRQVLEDRLATLGIPVIYGLSFGHIANKFTLPFGINAKLNTLDESIALQEPSVI
ncbi:MAG: LD-carboxypeptidase [Ignavibacteriae bacterium HGW-Ignavibacteriae-2]|jgi:muramoyltetrapeptide carboxypeptidase|nr:MAG: LD-carboxypeptidase [Ignavibacteriae bacterium HGW-Ignavibacteriae-2]